MRVYFESLGCPKNTADSEFMLGLLRFNNVEIAKSPQEADFLVVNTCGFIEPAKEESIETILELAEFKKSDPSKKLIVCGCLYERYKNQLKTQLPEVDGFVGVGELEKIISFFENSKLPDKPYCKRRSFFVPHIGYLKIGDGCSHGCSFCAIPLIKGTFYSRPIDELTEEARLLAENGVKELYLVAQDTTAYLREQNIKNGLVSLLEKLEGVDSIKWIRLLYTYPSLISDELVEFMSTSKKLVRYIDVPFQHVSDRLLSDMGREYTRKDIEHLIEKLRDRVKGIAIRSTFIVGFPTERDEDFLELVDFIEQYRLDWASFFAYYHEEGTLSYKRFEDLDEEIKQQRLEEIELLNLQVIENINETFLNKKFEVIIDGESDKEDYLQARSYRSAYEIDGIIYIKKQPHLKPGDFVSVRISQVEGVDVIGIVEEEK
ncbi:30S ribosomal protein S12 methylthiotransferase RimO [Hippea jasoniae]|uniref:30S ribosomal protein S12 methylthiotransferase RimO n=1 Tax=Hippea jasoniae TaxID=944479 RepID=UPI000554248C|nr:30S ribosomal protein S12 methylthiotransferase RimO [Hippea jasoniae]